MDNKTLEELFINMEELIFRVANVVVKYSPAAYNDMQHIFDNWKEIVKDILKE